MGLCHGHQEGLVPFRGTGGVVRALIVALDYKYSPNHELTCTADAQVIVRTCERAGIEDITVVTDKHMGDPGFPTNEHVLKHIRAVAKRCEPGDWFFWFFAGHGVNVPDKTGDEQDGFDEAFVTPDLEGHLTASAVLVDDDFARTLDHYVPAGVKILCVCDCCHSGTICDIDSFAYQHEIYQISASKDNEEAVDTGNGGVLTASLRRTIRDLSKRGEAEFSIQEVFDGCKKRAAGLSDLQELTLQFHGTHPKYVAWPLGFPWWQFLQGAKGDISDYEELEGQRRLN
uniref:Peptidase C14 caspase domain-containing protein n=1 Tax=Alexandrium monilatum TaxID=311494 RepID=A0A7S4V879_9DINO|mmetsp:Transcript_48826/g.145911  ORF Transcript_48826/g.145911 Transcript_48826/m.145911 type:complete len:286 (-) Transcript_48826:121-978(-)